jgi:hypothetical protein
MDGSAGGVCLCKQSVTVVRCRRELRVDSFGTSFVRLGKESTRVPRGMLCYCPGPRELGGGIVLTGRTFDSFHPTPSRHFEDDKTHYVPLLRPMPQNHLFPSGEPNSNC